jgi:hypothetical protein
MLGVIGFIAVDSGSTVNLTDIGSYDWGQWGYPYNPNTDNPFVIPFNHKKVGADPVGAISDQTKIGDYANNRALGSNLKYSWSDGTPVALANAVQGSDAARGDGNGFSFTVTLPKAPSGVLRVYGQAFSVDQKASIERIVATLTSDGTTQSQQSVDLRTGALGAMGLGYYQVPFEAPDGGSLSIRLTGLQTNSNSGILLSAATLSVTPEPASIISAATGLAAVILWLAWRRRTIGRGSSLPRTP